MRFSAPERLSKLAEALKTALLPTRDRIVEAEIVAHARKLAPVVWLLGKVQSGKTSLIRVATGASNAEIGNGFRACTKTARMFDFPEEAPLIRFLDTRGLGEVGYDAAEDLAICEGQAHLVVITMRVLDQQQEAIVDVVSAIRRRHPDWPIIVVQTALHEAYARGAVHVRPYPFKTTDPVALGAAGVSEDLIRALLRQQSLFADLSGKGAINFVPVDFTLAGDGWEPIDYGYDAFIETLQQGAPAAVLTALQGLHNDTDDRLAARADPHILGYATAAGAADLWPVAGLALVPIIQTKLMHALGAIYGVAWDRRTLREFAGALGASTVLRIASGFGLRELAKLAPIYGQTVGAAAAALSNFATTYALGKAACYFLERRKASVRVSDDIAKVYKDSLKFALCLARERGLSNPQKTE